MNNEERLADVALPQIALYLTVSIVTGQVPWTAES